MKKQAIAMRLQTGLIKQNVAKNDTAIVQCC